MPKSKVKSLFKWFGAIIFVFLSVLVIIDEVSREKVVEVSLKDPAFATPELRKEIHNYLSAERTVRDPRKIETVEDLIDQSKRNRVDFLGIGGRDYHKSHFSDSKCVMEIRWYDEEYEICRSPKLGWYMARHRHTAYKYDRGYTFYRLTEAQATNLLLRIRAVVFGK